MVITNYGYVYNNLKFYFYPDWWQQSERAGSCFIQSKNPV